MAVSATAANKQRGSAPGNSPNNHEGLLSRRHRRGQRSVRGLVRPVLVTDKETQERPPLPCHVVADRPAQHGIAGFEGVKDRAQRGDAVNLQMHLAFHAGERPKMLRKYDLYMVHG